MPTVIDSLILEVGLDPKPFKKGGQEVIKVVKDTKKVIDQSGKDLVVGGERVAETFSKIRNQVMGTFAAFFGARALVQFGKDVTKVDAEVGRMSKVLDTGTAVLSTWRGAAVLAGGTAAGMSGSIQGLVSQFQNFAITGESGVVPYFRALGVSISDINTGKMRQVNDILLDLADRFKGMDPARAAAFGNALGLDAGTIQLLIKGRDAVKALLDEQKQLGVVSEEDAKRAQELETAWNRLAAAGTGLGRAILNNLTPGLVSVFDSVTNVFKWFRQTGQSTFADRFEGAKYASGAPVTPSYNPGGTAVAASAGGLRLKPGATAGGASSAGLMALATSLQSDIPGLNRFTALNDQYHAGKPSKHNQGLALDFTLTDPAQSAAVAAQVRAKLAAMGVDARVIDEYTNPSAGATGGHLHVQFNSADAAQRYSDIAGAGAGGGDTVSNRTSTQTSQTTIGNITVNTQATDAAGVARDLKPALERSSYASQGNYGQQ